MRNKRNNVRLAASRKQIVSVWPPVACKSCMRLAGQSHSNCTRVAASRMLIPVDFIHVACDWWPRVQFACDWRPLAYNLNATGGHSGTI
jgi:hypothetical protein